MYDDLKSVRVKIHEKIATVTIKHPPLNLFDGRLIRDMSTVAHALAKDESVQVLIIESADPDFFIAHADVNLIMRGAETPPQGDPPDSFFQAMTECFRTMPKITIGKINGIARGGGLELLAALDMRFCSLENTRLAQPEVGLGIVPGGGGSVYWPELIGPSRALELLLACEDFDGALAERYGLVNRAVPEVELDELVKRASHRIASFPSDAVAEAKRLVRSMSNLTISLEEERKTFFKLASGNNTSSAMQAFLKRGGQDRTYELGDLFC
ncbi:MAG: enoyl-CoA hydratase/isomerase family protein [Pseudomonadota bacterium]